MSNAMIKLKRGPEAHIEKLYPDGNAPAGEPIFAIDAKKLYICTGERNNETGKPIFAIFESSAALKSEFEQSMRKAIKYAFIL